MIAGCPVDGNLLECLARSRLDFLLVSLATVTGFLWVWRRWAPLVLALTLAALLLLLRRWGVMA